ncbi:MAG: hypothetical protein JWO52_7265 [Gammaproteobacteria bacterium]|nr:hypothetical protein [Gammaproteobacteria bacterium]
MFKNFRTSLVLVLALGCAGPVLAQADATPHQVYEAVKAGHLDQAHTMINQVLQHHPESAEAHYVAAEVYAREGNLASARQELATAETIRPGLPFAKPDAVQRLQRELAQGQTMRMAPQSQSGQRNSQVRSAIPWGFLLVVVGVIAVLWAVMRRRSAAAVYQQYPGAGPVVAGGAPTGYGPGPGYGPGYGGGPGMGSGIAGGLASGLAVGAGVVAGEELAHHFLDGDREGRVVPREEESPPANPNGDMGGNDFGVSDGGGSWDDSSGGGGGGGGGDDWT